MRCIQLNCERSTDKGYALYRVSPKGQDFEGMCEEHLTSDPEPIAQMIERRNRDQVQ